MQNNRMQNDEEHHAAEAIQAGAVELPAIIKQLMRIVSKFMTKSSYHL